MTRMLLRARRWARGSVRPQPQLFTFHRLAFCRATQLVCLFYVCQLILVSEALQRWYLLQTINHLIPLWPVAWIPMVGIRTGLAVLMGTFLIGTFASVLFPQVRLCRIGAFLGLIWYCAFINSFANIHHATQAWVLISFILIFLPSGSTEMFHSSRVLRGRYLTVIFSAQALLLMLYGLSGVWKILTGLYQTAVHGFSIFSLDGLANVVAAYLVADGTVSPFWPVLKGAAWIGAPLFLGVVYMETASWWVIFRPALHRPWGVYLALMHILNGAILNMEFHAVILPIGLWLILSPFRPRQITLRETLTHVPLIGRVLNRTLR